MKKFLILLPMVLVGCVKPEEPPKDLRVVEVELVAVEFGHKAEAVITLKDLKRDMDFRKSIYCSDWQVEKQLSKKIGTKYKVFESGNHIEPKYYDLNSRFC